MSKLAVGMIVIAFAPMTFAAGESCQSLFEVAPFPSIYRIPRNLQLRALESQRTRNLAHALRGAIAKVDEIVKDPVGVVLFQPGVPIESMLRLPNWRPSPAREFPERFFAVHLAGKIDDEAAVRDRFKFLSEFLGDPNLSSEELAVLAFATRNLPALSSSHEHAEDLDHRIEDALHALFLRGHSSLPVFREFLDANLLVFVEFATLNRTIMLSEHPNARDRARAMGDEVYAERLFNSLQGVKGLSLEDKIAKARSLLDPFLARAEAPLFETALLPRQSARNQDKWLVLGTALIRGVYKKISEAAEGLSPTDLHTGLAEYLKMLNDGKPIEVGHSSKDNSLLITGLLTINTKILETRGRNPTVLKNQVYESLIRLAGELKRAAQELQKEVQAVELEKIKLQLAGQQGVTLPGKRKKNSGETIAPGPSIRQAERRARAKASLAASNGTAEVEAAPVEPSGPKLLEAKLQGIELGQSYWFDKLKTDTAPVGKGQFVKFTKRVVDDFADKHENLEQWIQAFLLGLAPAQGANGIKRIQGKKSVLWEIKIQTSSFRVMVEHNKDARTWKWLAVVHHDKVLEFKLNNGY